MVNDVVIAGAARTAIGRLSGTLANFSAAELGAALMRSLCERLALAPASVDEVVLGQALMAGAGQNPARQAAIGAGLANTVAALTVNQVGGSGLAAVIQASRGIALGESRLAIAGGQESVSQAPHLLLHSRGGQRSGAWPMLDSMIHDGLWDGFEQAPMGLMAERVAARFRVSRADQDALAAASQQRSEDAAKRGRFEAEIAPISVPQKRGEPVAFARDEIPRPGVTAAQLSERPPAFRRDGCVTAGNASPLGDGAALLVLTTRERAEALGLRPLVRIAAHASVGVAPSLMGIASVSACEQCLARAGWSAAALDLIELEEAFAAQVLAVNRQMGWNADCVNVNGGAIALGHPIGASGARILVTLIHEMHRREAARGIASVSAGGGIGVAVAVERIG